MGILAAAGLDGDFEQIACKMAISMSKHIFHKVPKNSEKPRIQP